MQHKITSMQCTEAWRCPRRAEEMQLSRAAKPVLKLWAKPAFYGVTPWDWDDTLHMMAVRLEG